MNNHLRFSWGHIIAFVALIVLSYMTFMGVAYKSGGDFVKASLLTVVVVAALVVVFLGAQALKATEKWFSVRMRLERICVFISPIVFVIAMLPFYHFGTVHRQNDEIVEHFTSAITASVQLFSDYEAYADNRVAEYGRMLSGVVNNRDGSPKEFAACGFSGPNANVQRNSMVAALRTQLLGNYDTLRNSAVRWIGESSDGASTWNVFILGNTRQIKAAIHEWCGMLEGFSDHVMTNEEFNGYNKVERFVETSGSLAAVDDGLDGLTEMFTTSAFPPVWSILMSVVLYFALLFPYFLQDRHSKSRCRLVWGGIGSRGGRGNAASDDLEEGTSSGNTVSSRDEDGFGSFTL